jgi:hypothetical protein
VRPAAHRLADLASARYRRTVGVPQVSEWKAEDSVRRVDMKKACMRGGNFVVNMHKSKGRLNNQFGESL